MLENSKQRTDALDEVRETLQLPPKKRAEFNHFLDECCLDKQMTQPGDLIATYDFAGLHDIILYGINANAENGNHEYDTEAMKRVTKVNILLNNAGVAIPFGQNRLWVLSSL